MAKKKKTAGRPRGKYPGGYVSAYKKREIAHIRLPAWMLAKLDLLEKENISRYVERLILEDTEWKEPKK